MNLKKLLLCLKWDVDNIGDLNLKRDYLSGRIADIQEHVKNTSIPDVVNQRELLIDFAMKRNNAPDFVRGQYERDVDEYLSKIK